MKYIIKFCALVLWASLGLAQTKPNFEPPPKGLRIGMEIELTPQSLANLMNDFDFKKAQKNSAGSVDVPANFYDDYLQNSPDAFSQLPKRLVKKLTQGLQLEETVIHRETGIVGADGKPLASQPKLILPSSVTASAPSQELIIPGRPPSGAGSVINENKVPESFQKNQENLVVPKNSSWQKVYERWMALPKSEKAAVVKWENLSSKKKADLAINVYKVGHKLDLKKNLPESTRNIYKNLSWGKDGSALEFRHKENVKITNLDDFYTDAVGLAKRAGVESKILNPQDSKITTATFHYHVSIDGQDLREQGKALNELAAVQRLNRGILSDVTGRGNYLFEPNAEKKGLVRVVNDGRIEVRNHNIPLAEELKFTVGALGMDKKQGLQTIRSQTQSMMSDYVVDKLALHPEYLSGFMKYMNPEQKGRVASQAQWASDLKKIHDGKISPTQRFWDSAIDLLRSPHESTSTRTFETLKRIENWPENVWQEYVDAIKDPAFASSRNASDLALSKNYGSLNATQVQNIENQLSEIWSKNPQARTQILQMVANSKVSHNDDLIVKMVLDVNQNKYAVTNSEQIKKLSLTDQQMIKVLKAIPPGDPLSKEITDAFSNIDKNGRYKTTKRLSPELKDAYERYLSGLNTKLRDLELAKKPFAGRPGSSDIYAKAFAETRSFVDALKDPAFASSREAFALAFSKNYGSLNATQVQNIENQLSEIWSKNPQTRTQILQLVANTKTSHNDDLIVKMVLDLNQNKNAVINSEQIKKLNLTDQQMIKVLKAIPRGVPLSKDITDAFSNIDENGRYKTTKPLSPELKDAYSHYLSGFSEELREEELAKKAFAGRPGVSDIYAKIFAETRSGEAAKMLTETGLDSPQTQETIRKMLRSSNPHDVHVASYIVSSYRGRLPVSLANEAAQVAKDLPESWARTWLNHTLEDNKANRRISIKGGVNARCVLQSLKALELKPK